MATMRMRFRHVDLSWIALVLSGMLVGAVLVVGITHVSQGKPLASAPVVTAPQTQVSEPIGGRLGGIASADTANDAQVKETLARFAAPVSGPLADRPHKNLVGGDQTLQTNEPATLDNAPTDKTTGTAPPACPSIYRALCPAPAPSGGSDTGDR